MTSKWHNLAQLPGNASVLVALALIGCTESHSPADRCDMTKQCFATDSLGCCSASATSVSVCDSCPSGAVERHDCRTSGCDNCGTAKFIPPDDSDGRPATYDAGATNMAPPPNCYEDLGGGCCGVQVFNADRCATGCPAGSIDQWSCTAYQPECACVVDMDPRPPSEPDPAPAADAGTSPMPTFDAGAPIAPPGAPPPPPQCFVDLGGGCCGDYAGNETSCGCPAGTLSERDCGGYSATGEAPPVDNIRERAPDACYSRVDDNSCGDEMIAPNACTGECPDGWIRESDCTYWLGG